MSWAGGIVAYLLIWWALLFAVLPLGVKRPEHPQPGTDPGAPDRPMLLKKAIITSLLSAVVWLGVYAMVESNYVKFRPY